MDIIKNLVSDIDWAAFIAAIWTIVCVPIGKQVYDYLKTKKLDKYAKILYDEVVKAVKAVWETEVKNIKDNPKIWTKAKQNEVKEIAKLKAVQAISNSAYKMLQEANDDFENWMDSMIETALYDLKHT